MADTIKIHKTAVYDDEEGGCEVDMICTFGEESWASTFSLSVELSKKQIDALFEKGEVKRLRASALQSVRPVGFKGDWRGNPASSQQPPA